MKKSVMIISLSIVMLLMLSVFLYIHRTTPPMQKIDQKVTGEDSAGTIIQGSTIVIYNTPHKEEREISRLQIQYIRAFGAYRVPLMMKYILSKYDPQNELVDAAPEFRRQWEEKFKSLYAVRSEAWDEIEKEKFSGKFLYSKILNPVKGDVVKFCLNGIKYSGYAYRDIQEKETIKFFENKLHMTVPKDWENELDGANEGDIGFLFIVVENNTEKSFSDITLSYELVKNNIMVNDTLGLCESANLDWKKKNSNALTDETLKNSEKIQLDKRISQLQPGESVIWLLHAYKSKDDGMPEYYLTDIEIPRKITFMTNGKTMEQDVRAPYGLQAARMHLPKDWMSMKIWMGQ